jgi:GDPmannose 4,6-dehydratase
LGYQFRPEYDENNSLSSSLFSVGFTRQYDHSSIYSTSRSTIFLRKALVTGVTGQDGSYLVELLLSKGYEVHGLVRRASTFNTARIDHLFQDPHEKDVALYLHHGDMADASGMGELISSIKPDEIYNLAAQSHVRVSFETPVYTGDITGLGFTRLMEAVAKSGVEPRLYQASSSEMFGASPPPQNETTPFMPQSPYAAAKVYAYHMARQYREGHGLYVSNGILFNHESPRRGETFVTRKVTMAIARIKAGLQNELFLGNLDSYRDWGYAPEYVTAMWRILQQDEPGDYVIGTGSTVSVKDFVDQSFSYAGLDPAEYIRTDERYFRPLEVPSLLADPSKSMSQLDWAAETDHSHLAQIMVDADMDILGVENPGVGKEWAYRNGEPFYAWPSKA